MTGTFAIILKYTPTNMHSAPAEMNVYTITNGRKL